jgi:hypothetical protein
MIYNGIIQRSGAQALMLADASGVAIDARN